MHFMRHNAKLARMTKTMYDDVVFVFCMSAYGFIRKTMYTRVNNIIVLLELRIMAPPTGFDLQTTTSG